jgi:hypothetical protein
MIAACEFNSTEPWNESKGDVSFVGARCIADGLGDELCPVFLPVNARCPLICDFPEFPSDQLQPVEIRVNRRTIERGGRPEAGNL